MVLCQAIHPFSTKGLAKKSGKWCGQSTTWGGKTECQETISTDLKEGRDTVRYIFR